MSERERGSIVVIAMISIVGVSTVAASMVSTLNRSTVSASQNTKFVDGMGIADSLRMGVEFLSNKDADDIARDVSDNAEGLETLEAIETRDGKKGFDGLAGGAGYGYRFYTENPGIGGGSTFKSGENLKGCKKKGNTIECKWNKGQAPDVDEPYRFSSNSTINLNPNAEVEFGDIVVFEGDVNIGPNNPSQPYREIDMGAVIITGDLTSDFTLKTDETFDGCETRTVSSASFGNGRGIFKKLAVGGTATSSGTHGTFTYAENLDCETEVEVNDETRTLRLDSLTTTAGGGGASDPMSKGWTFKD